MIDQDKPQNLRIPSKGKTRMKGRCGGWTARCRPNKCAIVWKKGYIPGNCKAKVGGR